MYGDGTGDPETEGMIPRVCKALFEHIEAAKDEGENVTYKVHVSMIEVYLENVFDLLNNKERLAIRGRCLCVFLCGGGGLSRDVGQRCIRREDTSEAA